MDGNARGLRGEGVDGSNAVKGVSRRSVVKAGGACLVGRALAPVATWGQAAGGGDELQRWIERSAVRIDREGDEFGSAREQERVLAAIGRARIVMLGEPSHGAGSAFAAKVGLVKLLHEKLGFDVLVWGSGLIDLERTDAGLCGDGDAVEAAQRGILKIWSASAECRPLFEYAKASHHGARPLTMAGFDMQLTAAGTLDYFAGELQEFVRTLALAMRSRAEAQAEQVLDCFGRMNRYPEALAAKNAVLGSAHLTGAGLAAAIAEWEKSVGDGLRPKAEDLERLTEAAAGLEVLLGRDNGAVPAGRAGFMMRAIAGLAGYGTNLWELYGKHSAEESARFAMTTENRRDQINAETLRWQIDTAYAGRKVMVWAHNAHVMNAWYGKGFDSVSLEPVADGMKPMGVWLSGWYGDAVYRIGGTAYAGSDGWAGATPSPIEVAPAGSLEERLHRMGSAEAFLPLRGMPDGPVSLRIPKYKMETVANPAQVFDALYFVDQMKPATAI